MKRPELTRYLYAPLLLCVSLSGCSEAPLWTGSVEMRNGVEAITNPGTPLLEQAEDMVSELWTLHEASWMDASRVHVQRDLITVVDPPANQVHLISTSGEVRASLGRPGDGPGEFRRLLDAFPSGDELVVLDGGKSNIQYLSFDGEYLSSLHVHGQTWSGFLLDTGELLLQGEFLSDPHEESFGDWVTLREGIEPVAFTSLSLEPLPEEQGVRCSGFSSWAGGAARMRFTTPQIQVFDPAGSLLNTIELDLPVEVVSDSERDSAISALESDLASRGLPPPFIEQNLVVMAERWRVKCRFGPLRFDPVGRFAAFLEQNPDDFGAGSATLHVLSREGVYLATLDFPDAWRDFTINDGVVYALTRNSETDLITLRAYRVDLPDSALAEAAEVLEEARRGAGRVR